MSSHRPLPDEALEREGAGWAHDRLSALGRRAGAHDTQALARLAHANPPVPRSHDAAGNRIDEVEFHPAWHALMGMGMAARRAFPGLDRGPPRRPCGARGPGLRDEPGGKRRLLPAGHDLRGGPRAAAPAGPCRGMDPPHHRHRYDPRHIPAAEKTACTMGMAMTEKQGGSDVRANTTVAEPDGRRIPADRP